MTIEKAFPNWRIAEPGCWVPAHIDNFIGKFEIGLYREPLSNTEYAGSYTLQAFHYDNVVFTKTVDRELYDGLGFKDIRAGDIVTVIDWSKHDAPEYHILVKSAEKDREYATESNPEGLVFYGECVDDHEECDDYLEVVTEENFHRFGRP